MKSYDIIQYANDCHFMKIDCNQHWYLNPRNITSSVCVCIPLPVSLKCLKELKIKIPNVFQTYMKKSIIYFYHNNIVYSTILHNGFYVMSDINHINTSIYSLTIARDYRIALYSSKNNLLKMKLALA